MLNCEYSHKAHVYLGYNQDNSGYYGVLISNWNDFSAQSVILDFYLMGIAEVPYYTCRIYDIWAGKVLGDFGTLFTVYNVPVHDSFAYKVTCKSFFSESLPSAATESQLFLD